MKHCDKTAKIVLAVLSQCFIVLASTMGESLIWQPAIYLANKLSLFLSLALSLSLL